MGFAFLRKLELSWKLLKFKNQLPTSKQSIANPSPWPFFLRLMLIIIKVVIGRCLTIHILYRALILCVGYVLINLYPTRIYVQILEKSPKLMHGGGLKVRCCCLRRGGPRIRKRDCANLKVGSVVAHVSRTCIWWLSCGWGRASRASRARFPGMRDSRCQMACTYWAWVRPVQNMRILYYYYYYIHYHESRYTRLIN